LRGERCATSSGVETWWRRHRDARELFADELLEALVRIRQDPTLGRSYRTADGREQRRLLMPKTGHHVYFRMDGEAVLVLTVWGARRGRPPAI